MAGCGLPQCMWELLAKRHAQQSRGKTCSRRQGRQPSYSKYRSTDHPIHTAPLLLLRPQPRLLLHLLPQRLLPQGRCREGSCGHVCQPGLRFAPAPYACTEHRRPWRPSPSPQITRQLPPASHLKLCLLPLPPLRLAGRLEGAVGAQPQGGLLCTCRHDTRGHTNWRRFMASGLGGAGKSRGCQRSMWLQAGRRAGRRILPATLKSAG